MARMTAPNGATVTVDDKRVDLFARNGFVLVDEPKKATAKKAAAKKSGK